MTYIPCPKCGGSSWLKKERQEIWHRCLCGYAKMVEVDVGGGVKILHAAATPEVELPRKGSKLAAIFWAVVGEFPGEVTTARVAYLAREDTSNAASRLTVLMSKGLLERTAERRGMAGGSSWVLSYKAQQILKL